MFIEKCWNIYLHAWFAWKGQSLEDICSMITKVDARYWHYQRDECQIMVFRRFLSYYIPMRDITFFLVLVWYTKHLSIFLMRWMISRSKHDKYNIKIQ